MISSLDTNFDLSGSDVGYIVGDYPIGTQKFNVYIPRLMVNIKKTNSKIYIPTNYNRTRYTNAETCRPNVSSKVYAKNYIEATVESNANVDQFAVNGIIKDGTKVMCRYRNGLLSHVTINTDQL